MLLNSLVFKCLKRAVANGVIAAMRTYTLTQAAAILSLHKDTLAKMAAKQLVPATKPGKKWVFPADQLDAWLLERCKVVNNMRSDQPNESQP